MKKRCQVAFKSSSALVFMVPGESLVWPKANTVDVIFMGSALNLITQKYLWPPKIKVRLWVLSKTHKKLLIKFLKLDSDEISVIPRNLLFPLKRLKKVEEQIFNKDVDLIFSGRFITSKNFELCMKVAHMLQVKSSYQTNYFLCGPHLTEKDKKMFHTEISKYKWKRKPKFLGDLGDQWVKKIKGSPVLLTLSTYIQEDFGVSVAQAEAEGWPLIISQWGGHVDVEGRNCKKIPAKHIFNNDSDSIVNLCLKKTKPFEKNSECKLKRPRVISYEKIEKRVNSLHAKTVKGFQKAFSDEDDRDLFISKVFDKEIKKILGNSYQ